MIRLCEDSGGIPHAAVGQSPRCAAHRAARKRYTDTACQRRKRHLPQVSYTPVASPLGPEARVLSDDDVAYLDELGDQVRIRLGPLTLASRRARPYSGGDVDQLLTDIEELLIALQERISAPTPPLRAGPADSVTSRRAARRGRP